LSFDQFGSLKDNRISNVGYIMKFKRKLSIFDAPQKIHWHATPPKGRKTGELGEFCT